MTAFSLSRALLLAVLAAAGVNGNPVGLGSDSSVVAAGQKCGDTICQAGLTCCNPSCGICVKPGMKCTMQACTKSSPAPPVVTPREDDKTTQCGPARCKEGTECCNESCGICVEPGKGCTKQLCLPAGKVCGNKVCAEGLVCCNERCGLCAPPDGGCTMQLCLEKSE
ncbi:uncharacterized protein P884DRAFT_332298 [Thermothelomyces heterothallicus CBS 202.75]|uniref:uncharacterized protein n=1 Tax=Thermothelomyces heterothallicus CBS 202.75 TaxID=1149848 RepID=UPI0037422C4D